MDLVKPWAWLFDYGLFFRLFAHIRSSQVAIFLVKESKKCFLMGYKFFFAIVVVTTKRYACVVVSAFILHYYPTTYLSREFANPKPDNKIAIVNSTF